MLIMKRILDFIKKLIGIKKKAKKYFGAHKIASDYKKQQEKIVAQQLSENLKRDIIEKHASDTKGEINISPEEPKKVKKKRGRPPKKNKGKQKGE